MSSLDQQFEEDRRLRDAARAVLLADLEHARSSFSAKGVADRIGSRIGDGAVDVFETARTQASDHRGIIAALIGAVVLWFGREPILAALGLDGSADTPPEAPETDSAKTDTSAPFAGDDHEH